MSDIEIDPETGLPRLDEDQRWNVIGFMDTHKYRVYAVEIQRFIPARTESVRYEITPAKYRHSFWGKPKELLADPVYGTRTVQHDEKWVLEAQSLFEENEALTKEAILKHATDLIRQRKIMAERQALLGTYPPNRLEIK